MSYPKNPRRTGKRGITLIKIFEGLRTTAYKCPAQKWTIGYGHTRTAEPGMLITEEEAVDLLQKDLEFFEAGVRKAVDVKITQNQFDALVSFAFNVGLGNFRKSTLLKKLNKGDDWGASQEFVRWKYSNGKVLPGLLRRRRAERELFMSGR